MTGDAGADRPEAWRTFQPPAGLTALAEAGVARLVPVRDAHGHKGSFGTLLCVCGSLDYLGAALLVTRAALRAGVGLAIVAVPASLQPLIAGRVPEAITLGLPEVAAGDVDALPAAAFLAEQKQTALLVGPGLKPGEGTRNLVRRVAAAKGVPAVLDAEALNSLAASDAWWKLLKRPLVITPHPGEFARLDGSPLGDADSERAERVLAAAARWGCVVVLKGANTLIAAPDGRLLMAPFANAAMGTGGTGDVLAGIAGSLLAQGLAPFDAACLAVWLHGVAGEHIRERIGDAGLLAGELADEVPRIRRHLTTIGRQVAHGGGRLGFARPDA